MDPISSWIGIVLVLKWIDTRRVRWLSQRDFDRITRENSTSGKTKVLEKIGK